MAPCTWAAPASSPAVTSRLPAQPTANTIAMTVASATTALHRRNERAREGERAGR